MEWSFSDVPLDALFRPKWAQNEIRRIDWVNMQFGQLAPAGLVPAVYIGGQPWTVDQLPNAFDYGWDGVTWHECAGPVIRPADVGANLEEVYSQLSNALRIGAELSGKIEELGSEVQRLRSEVAAMKERKTVDEARAGTDKPAETGAEAPPQGGAKKPAK